MPNARWNRVFVFLAFVDVWRSCQNPESRPPRLVFMRLLHTRVNTSYRRVWCDPEAWRNRKKVAQVLDAA